MRASFWWIWHDSLLQIREQETGKEYGTNVRSLVWGDRKRSREDRGTWCVDIKGRNKEMHHSEWLYMVCSRDVKLRVLQGPHASHLCCFEGCTCVHRPLGRAPGVLAKGRLFDTFNWFILTALVRYKSMHHTQWPHGHVPAALKKKNQCMWLDHVHNVDTWLFSLWKCSNPSPINVHPWCFSIECWNTLGVKVT